MQNKKLIRFVESFILFPIITMSGSLGGVLPQAGSGIVCKLALSFQYNLFAGTAWWKKAEGVDKKIVCGKLESGTIAYGDLEETGMPDEQPTSLKGKEVEVKLDGKTYRAIIQ